jgi:hypothetical protein
MRAAVTVEWSRSSRSATRRPAGDVVGRQVGEGGRDPVEGGESVLDVVE